MVLGVIVAGGQVRDFHIGLMESYPSVRAYMRAEYGDVEACFDSVEGFAQCVVELRGSGDNRGELAQELREVCWKIRNAREFPDVEARSDALVVCAQLLQLMGAAGFPEKDLRATVECLSHACTCDGCDLADGRRFAEGAWLRAGQILINL